MTLEEILKLPAEELIEYFKSNKGANVPPWEELMKMYYPSEHEINNKAIYPDPLDPTESKPSRVTYNMAHQAVMTFVGLCVGISPQRIYNIEKDESGNENQEQVEASVLIERIFSKANINSVYFDRYEQLFSSCEFVTLWRGKKLEQIHYLYGKENPTTLKIQSETFSPLGGAKIYPLFDEDNDYIAIGIMTSRKVNGTDVNYFDVYTKDKHLRITDESGEFVKRDPETIKLGGKNPTIYGHKERAIYQDGHGKNEEIERMLSSNGNYLRKNSKPLFGVFGDEVYDSGESEKNEREEYRTIMQWEKDARAGYITWDQAIESLKYQDEKLEQMYYDEMGLPNLSFSALMKLQLSGEAYDQVMIAAIIRVLREVGGIQKTSLREVNIVKEFARIIRPDLSDAITALDVDIKVTPYKITNEQNMATYLSIATGGRSFMSQLDAIKLSGKSKNPQETLEQIQKEQQDESTGVAMF